MGEKRERDQLSATWKREIDGSWDRLMREGTFDNRHLFTLYKKEGEILLNYPLEQVASMYGKGKRVNMAIIVLKKIALKEKPTLILDVGAGPYPEIVLKMGNGNTFVIALDISPVNSRIAKAVAKMRKKSMFEVIASDASQLPFRTEVFDLIICCDTLEHLLEPWKALKEFRRTPRKQSKIFLTVPNKDRFDVLLRKFQYRLYRIKKEEKDYFMTKSHITEYTFFTFRGLLRMACLKIIRKYNIGDEKSAKSRFQRIVNFLIEQGFLGFFNTHITVLCKRME